MALTTLPTKTDASIGRVKSDRTPTGAPPADLDFDVPAAEYERLKDAIVDLGTSIGLDDGSTSGSLREELGLLFRWNKTDLSQFDFQLRFRNTLGTAPVGTMAPVFVANAFQGVPGIRLQATGLNHGIILPVLLSELTLPSRYIVRAHVVAIATNLVACVGPFGLDAQSDWQGAVYRRDAGGTTSQPRLTTDAAGNQTLRSTGVASVNPAADTWNTTLEQRGGMFIELECWRQNGDNPTDWAYRIVTQEASSHDAGALSRQDCTGAADPSTDWDGSDHDRLGIGILADTGGNENGDVDFIDIEVRSV